MPHMNVLDLSVFPCMSRRHIELCRQNGGPQVLQNDKIWENAQNVWATLPNQKIASGYIHAYRIAAKVIKSSGNNDFLRAGSAEGLHTGIGKDFLKTSNGMCQSDKEKVKPGHCSK